MLISPLACVMQKGIGTANTSVVFHAQRLLALQESDLPYAVRCTMRFTSTIKVLAKRILRYYKASL